MTPTTDPTDLPSILTRIEWRLKALNLSADRASKLAGKPDAIRNMKRAVADNKPSSVNTNTLAALAPVLKTSVSWLFEAEGPEEVATSLPRQVDIVGYVAAGVQEVTFADGQGPFGTVDAPIYATDSTVAVEVRGTSLGPFMDRWLIFYDRIERQPGPDFEGRLCVVGLADGRVMVKALKHAKTPGYWHLISNNPIEPQINDQAVLWAALVRGMQAI